MIRNFIYIFFISFNSILAQNKLAVSENISDCKNAFQILTPGSYNFQFSGTSGESNDLEKYASLLSIEEKNSLWFSFETPLDGCLSMNISSAKGFVKMILFTNESNDICEDILNGKAQIKRTILNPKKSEIGLSLSTNENFYYPMNLLKDQQVMIVFLHESQEKVELNLKVNYESSCDLFTLVSTESKIVDQRKNKYSPAFSIIIRDIETGKPVISDVLITEIKSISALYNGSDLFFTVEKSSKASIRIDAQGYFFIDREEFIPKGLEHQIVIWLEPIKKGKSMKLDEIEFLPGTSNFLLTSEPKLSHLRDFLLLNNEVKIEIQGHVQSSGKNTHAAKKISRNRAMKVMAYLIENGIDKNRMAIKGYGNSKPIYPHPKLPYEEQANRRVEIKIIEN